MWLPASVISLLQRYVDDPCALATTILWFLEKEKEILESAELAEKVGVTSHCGN